MQVMEDRMTQVRSSSMSVASLVSSGVGASVMDEIVGVDTQDGGPKFLSILTGRWSCYQHAGACCDWCDQWGNPVSWRRHQV
jgi:hypothetical protein